MTDAVVSNLGQRRLTGDEEALFRDVFTGEVLTAYHAKLKLKDKVESRSIQHGNSATFNAIDRASGGYHTAGTEIKGRPIAHADITITVDNELISDTFIARIHEAKNHYDVRAPYANEQGHYLAKQEDRNIARMLIKAARGGELFAGDGGGGSLTNANYLTDGGLLAAAMYAGKEALESKGIDVELQDVYAALKPAQWYALVQAEKMAHRDYNPQADYQKGTFRMVGGVDVMRSEAFPWGSNDTVYDAGTNATGTVANPNLPMEPVDLPSKYHIDMTNTVGAIWTKSAVGIVNLLGMDFDMTWDPRRRGYLAVAAMAQGIGTLRNKCAIELKTA